MESPFTEASNNARGRQLMVLMKSAVKGSLARGGDWIRTRFGFLALLLLALLCLLHSKPSASLKETGPPVGRAV